MPYAVNNRTAHPLWFLVILFLLPFKLFPQQPDTMHYKTVAAGSQYKRTGMHNWLWGKHYRPDWATPVTVSTINLDTVNGGLTPYQKGGGRQSKTLRLRNSSGREYVLRSIDKSFGNALPDIAKGTWVENVADDQVSISQPYAAITIPPMAAAAGIYHTNPKIVYVPSQKALGEYDKEYGNNIYLLEQRPDENWEDAPNFGNSRNIVGTEKMLEKILKDNDNSVDYLLFIRARLFDMFIADWGRHEDQWRWASYENGDKTVFRPIPRDRDQAYSKTDGFLFGIALSAVGDYIEGFGKKIQDVPLYNYTARNLDRRLMNQATNEDWIRIANELQAALTDQIIESSINLLPPPIAARSAKDIATTLKARREKLVDWAKTYYEFLAENVDIPGTSANEYFEIRIVSPEETAVEIYDLDMQGKRKKDPFYRRLFLSKETDEIRIYGIDGNDQFEINRLAGNNIKLRIIGGPKKDIYKTTENSSNHIIIYDDRDNDFSGLVNVRKELGKDSSIHAYVYDAFKYDKRGLGFSPSYNEEDRIHIKATYQWEKQQWRKQPYGYHHEIEARYSISESAPSIGYSGTMNHFLGNWDLHLLVNYDWIRWNNFYGIGNETKNLTTDANYNRVRSRQFDGAIEFGRIFANYNSFSIGGFYQTVKILDDAERFLHKQMPVFKEFETEKFAGLHVNYKYENLNNTVLPTKGFRFVAEARHTLHLQSTDSSVTNFSGGFHAYLPLGNSIVLALKSGGATLSGNPEFYQLNKVGGGKTLRGFRRYRFYGESMAYAQGELQIIPNIKSYLFNGRAGIVGFYDLGRVWQPGENSGTWHYGYGAGIVISPFNRIALTVFQGWSKNEKAIAIRFNAGF